ncbi:hypothetical protein ACHAWC_003481 [Mediolabrus comicus]
MPITTRQKTKGVDDEEVGIQITNSDVDNARLDFDAAIEPISNGNSQNRHQLMPSMNERSSLGTRSPSVSSVSDTSLGSKRSRTEFDNYYDDDSMAKKRAAAPTSALGSAAAEDTTSSAVRIRMDREREGRCPDCGLETHIMVRRDDGNFVREPLNIEGEVHNGRCLFCNPFDDGRSETSSQQFVHNVQTNGLSPIERSENWPSGKMGRNTPGNMFQSNNNGMRSPTNYRRNNGDVSVSSVSCADGVDGVDSQSVLTDDNDDHSIQSGNSGGMNELGLAVASGMGMSGKVSPRQQTQYQQRNRAPDPPQLSSILSSSRSPKPQTPKSMNSKTTLRKLSSDDVPRATRVYIESGSGDICDIVVAMRRFPFSLSIQRVACEKLYVHCFERDHALAIGMVGGIRTIIDAMEHHANDVQLQRTCASMIKHLACAGPYNLDMLDRMGAVGIIVTTMERHSQNALLLEACCWAIEGMAGVHSPEFKMRVARNGGIHACMKAVETFPDNDALLRAAFHCLRQLGYNPSSSGNQQNQQQVGGIPQNILMD